MHQYLLVKGTRDKQNKEKTTKQIQAIRLQSIKKGTKKITEQETKAHVKQKTKTI